MNIDNPEMARAVAEATAALNARMAPSQAVTRAGAMLQVARLGLRDMQESNEYRILLGFFGVVVFGRSITLVMQNFRRYDEAAFDRWYAPWRDEMKDDSLMLYFKELRRTIIHEDGPAIGVLLAADGRNAAKIGSITVDSLALPESHLGRPLEDRSMTNLCRLYVEYLERMHASFANLAFEVQDRLLTAPDAGGR